MIRQDPAIVIVDYGIGNLFSIAKVVKYLGGLPVISDNPRSLASAQKVILPGVGAFGDGMIGLEERGLVKALDDFVKSGRPLMGICLGMQLLLSESEEFGLHRGLDFIRGKTVRLKGSGSFGQRYKVPHVGWNRINMPREVKKNETAGAGSWDKTVFNGIQDGEFVYFVHSYASAPEARETILAETTYGQEVFCSAVSYKNVFGCQFHPEVSGEAGLRILSNFLHI